MGRCKSEKYSRQGLQTIYDESRDLPTMAKSLGISYPTAVKWANDFGLTIKKQGFNKPEAPITARQCRHAREYLKLTRVMFCRETGISKTSLQDFELGQSVMRRSTMEKVMKLFAKYGITFLDEETFTHDKKRQYEALTRDEEHLSV